MEKTFLGRSFIFKKAWGDEPQLTLTQQDVDLLVRLHKKNDVTCWSMKQGRTGKFYTELDEYRMAKEKEYREKLAQEAEVKPSDPQNHPQKVDDLPF